MDAKQEYINIIKEFVSKTSKGNLKWKKQNPTTLYLETESNLEEKTIISLQKIQERKRERIDAKMVIKNVEYYVFSVKKPNAKELVIQIDSSNERTYHEYLKNLFNIADYRIEKRSIDFLRGIMDKL